MKIILEPTNSLEMFRDIQFRLFKGVEYVTSAKVQMLGMFRILDAEERAKFVAVLAHHVQHEAPQVTAMLDASTLITGAEGTVRKRRELVAKCLEEIYGTGYASPTWRPNTEGSWSEFLAPADVLLAALEKAR